MCDSRSVLSLFDLMNCSLPDSSVHAGSLQARILERVATSTNFITLHRCNSLTANEQLGHFSKRIQLCTYHIKSSLKLHHHPLKLLVPTAGAVSVPTQAQTSLPLMKYLYGSLFGQIYSGSSVSMRQLVIQTQGHYRNVRLT